MVVDPARTQLLVVRRADNGAWTPVTGILDPGEEPARAAAREVTEETGIVCTPLRLADVRTLPMVTYTNGDQAQYLDLCFLCEADPAQEPYPADGENTAARWAPLTNLPPLNPRFREQLQIALSDDPAARFRW